MFFRLLFLFTAVPIAELFLLLWIGERIGLLATLALVFGTGILGAALARTQGLKTFLEVQREFAAGRLPASALIDGLLILVAGAVLLTPGLLTDLCGFFLLVPPGRRLVRGVLRRWFEKKVRGGPPGGGEGPVIIIER